MPADQFLPMPGDLHALTCETVSRRVRPLPFTEDGVTITANLVRAAMECLNAEATRTLPVRAAHGTGGRVDNGLDQCLEGHWGIVGDTTAPVLADVLVRAGIAAFAEVINRQHRTRARGVRLLPAWTWHIGSAPSFRFGTTPLPSGDSPAPAWMAVCPVCRTGILSRVTGRTLFGIHPTDYHIDCSHCGAKFVPEQEQFRLVSIARIADPGWRRYLNTSHLPDEWAAVAQGTPAPQPGAPAPAPEARKTRPMQGAAEGFPVVFPSMKDGALAVPCGRSTLYFRPVSLQFTGRLQRDLFARSDRTVKDVLATPAFQSVRSAVEQHHARYLPLRLGLFAGDLMRQGDPLVWDLLNRYGGGPFCLFHLRDDEQAGRKGVFMVYVQGRVCHTGACHIPFSAGIGGRVGRIMPEMCYRDGDETACRINRLVCASRTAPTLYIHGMSDDGVIDASAAALMSQYPAIAVESPVKDA